MSSSQYPAQREAVQPACARRTVTEGISGPEKESIRHNGTWSSMGEGTALIGVRITNSLYGKNNNEQNERKQMYTGRLAHRYQQYCIDGMTMSDFRILVGFFGFIPGMDSHSLAWMHWTHTWRGPVQILLRDRIDVADDHTKCVPSLPAAVGARPLLWLGALGAGPARRTHADAEIVVAVAGVAAAGARGAAPGGRLEGNRGLHA